MPEGPLPLFADATERLHRPRLPPGGTGGFEPPQFYCSLQRRNGREGPEIPPSWIGRFGPAGDL